jgi:hypothetical protein
MLQRYNAFKAQFGSVAIEGSDSNRVIENVVEKTEMRGLGRNFKARSDKSQIVAFPGAEHHAVCA